MICETCGKEIPRGKRFVNRQYTKYRFCSEECYNKFVSEKQNNPDPFIRLRDYINDIWQEADVIDWAVMTRSIKQIAKEFNLTFLQMYTIIRYAVEIEDYVVDVNTPINLWQFFPKFILPFQNYITQLNQNRKDAELKDGGEGEEECIVKPQAQTIFPHPHSYSFRTQQRLFNENLEEW